MNVLVIGKFSPDQFAFHISDSLKDMGHHTINFDPTLKYKYSKTMLGRRLQQLNHVVYNTLITTQFIREKRKKRLSGILSNTKIDLTISAHDFLYPDEVDFIKEKTKSPVVMCFPDSVGSFNKGLFLISGYNYLFFKDQYIVDLLSK